jgi:hypothetical protein
MAGCSDNDIKVWFIIRTNNLTKKEAVEQRVDIIIELFDNNR